MEGILKKDDTGWKIYYKIGNKFSDIDLHPDCVETVERLCYEYNNNIEDRFNTFPYIRFEITYPIIKNESGIVSRYAKLIE